MATHSSILAWDIPWTEETGGLQSMDLQRGGHSDVTEQLSTYTYTHTCTPQKLRQWLCAETGMGLCF